MTSIITRWIANFGRRKPETSALPLNTTPQDIEALKILRASPQWKHYRTLLERIGEQQAATLASGLPHEKYLFASGALTALRRVYTLVDDIIAAATNVKELSDARERNLATRNARTADTFVNTPWYDGWKRDADAGGTGT